MEPIINEFFDEEAEKSVLGAMLEDNKFIPACLEILGENPFLRIPHQIIYDTIRELQKQNVAVDAVTVGSALEKQGELNRIGGALYLYDLVNSVPTAENAEYYAGIIREKWGMRQLANIGKQIALLAHNGELSPAEMFSKAQQLVMSVDLKKEKAETIVEQANKAYRAWCGSADGQSIDIPTGFSNFDILTGGFGHKETIIVGGYPSVGKSAWVHNVLFYQSVLQGRPCLLLSYEDQATNIINRMVSMASGLNPRLDRESAKNPKVLEWFKLIQKSPMIINDVPPMVIDEVVMLILKTKQEIENLDVVVIDHIQLMSVPKAYNSEQEISKITRELKNVAKIANVALVALSHLSREAIKSGRRPILSDLRYSGMAEGNADKVCFVHREDYGEYQFDSPISEAEIIVAKNRNGPVGSIEMSYNRSISRFEEVIS